MKELIIDKNTNITRIKDKEEYTSLVIKTKINPNKLNGFINVKELIIDYKDRKECNYNEQNINLLPFKNNLEKLTFKEFAYFGVKETIPKTIYYNLNLPNLKSIEFPSNIERINNDYLEKLEKLEEITFNYNTSVYGVYLTNYIGLSSDKFKRIIIKYKNKEYVIKSDYLIKYIDDMNFDDEFIIEYSDGENIRSIVGINLDNDNISINNIFDLYECDNNIIIPDYITELQDYKRTDTYKISFNLNLLNHIKEYKEIIDNEYFNKIMEIELRNDNEMSLFPTKTINVKEYGNLEDLYFENNLLYLKYKDKTITVNNSGEIKIIKEKIEEIYKDLDLKKYTLEELENYVSYLRLLKLSDNIEYKNAMNIVEKELIKKLGTEVIKITNTKASNIYFENYPNLGGLTVPYNHVIDTVLVLKLSKLKSINEINILLKNNIVKNIKLDNAIDIVSIYKNEENNNLCIYVREAKKTITYNVDNNGNTNYKLERYRIDESDIIEGKDDKIVDLRSFKEYENIYFDEMNIDTIIIDKYLIENIDMLYSVNGNNYYHNPNINFKNLIINDASDMKLIPSNKKIENIKKIYFCSNNDTSNYIYLETEDNNEILIYIDSNNEIKIIEKNELLKNKKISNIIYEFEDWGMRLNSQNINLILIKYKNGTYRVIEFDKSYEIDTIFFKLLSINSDEYFKSENLRYLLNIFDLEMIFESGRFSNRTFHIMYNDYLNYKKYIESLKKLGFNNSAIKYLFDRKFDNIINPYNENIIDINKITKEEIEGFNYIGNEYIKKKRIKNNTKDMM